MKHPKVPIPYFDDITPWGGFTPSAGIAFLLSLGHMMPKSLTALTKLFRRPIKYGLMKPLDLVIWGLKLRLLPRGNMSEQKLYTAPQLFDSEEFALIESKLSLDGVFVDVGANAGVYSFWANLCMKGQGRIIAVEPDPEMRRRIEFNIRTNGLANIELCATALSDQEGVAMLQVNSRQRGQNTIDMVEAQLSGASYTEVAVPTTTLFALMKDKGVKKIDILKIDIEGHEPQVLNHFFKNAPETMWPHAVISEFKEQTASGIMELLATCGYSQIFATKLNYIFKRQTIS